MVDGLGGGSVVGVDWLHDVGGLSWILWLRVMLTSF